jgi:hypothetical protein
MRRAVVVIASLAAVLGTGSAQAQDWLSPHLESQRWYNNLNNNRDRSDRARSPRARSGPPPCTPDMVSSAERRQVEAEFQRRVRTQGYDRAYAWSIEQGRLTRQRMQARGVCR